ncbi:MAG: hypothetical protein Q8N35_16460 [Methylococcaceae bacterium]|nr:hypothetical protein [Methylococcaceae bacterium]MDZ4157385.1 hypothetical protein [Methylococcales bacterium]MDP2392674.1 hypothetical protein [Methylococcaceae bacterium]MDP3021175.1 hypothetical protein [Methylococcaceae bacterium]MDP3390140.1 hypothetical protein [Methylococcaceae bacterium]
MTPQSNFMIVAPVRDGQLDELRALLATMNRFIAHADPDNTLVPFGKFERLHFARFIIIEAKTADEIKAFGVTPRPWQPSLAFLGDCDGDRDSFLAELVEHAEHGLIEIFSLCEGYPDPNSEGLLAWMLAHDVQPRASYVNWLGRTVKQVHEEAALHRSLSAYLQEVVDDTYRNNPRALRQKLLSYVEMEKQAGRLTLTPPASTPIRWRIRNLLHMIGIPLILLLLSPVFLIIAPIFALRLRMLERSDPELPIRPSREHIKELSIQEDHDVTNQFNVFGDIKPGLFRLLTFKFLMLLTDYVARHIYNHGFLTRIRTIHFARWVFLDDNHRAFFASNYDGSHESYMDDFINKAGWGLNIAFGNAVGYPTTKWLIKGGAEREQQFKYTQRRHQFRSEVWYKAYPDLTATDLARNSRIRQGVEIRPSSDAEIRDWLSQI